MSMTVHTALAQDIRWSTNDDKGNRYEGLVSFTRAKPGIQVVSFTSYMAAVPRGKAELLFVKFFALQEASPRVESRELTPSSHQYRMESKPWRVAPSCWNTFGPWPTAEVLVKSGIAVEQLGVVVHLPSLAGTHRLAPAAVYAADETKPEDYTLRVRTSWPQVWLRCTLRAGGRPLDGGCGIPQDRVAAGQIVTFQISTSSLPEGDIVVTLEGQDRDRDGGPLEEFVFFNKKSIGNC
jgi:hypothetical protein